MQRNKQILRRKFIKDSLAVVGSLDMLGFSMQGFAKILKSQTNHKKEQTINLTKKGTTKFYRDFWQHKCLTNKNRP